MREHFYTIILYDKKTKEEIISFEMGKKINPAISLFEDLSRVVKASQALLILYEDYKTEHEQKIRTNKK